MRGDLCHWAKYDVALCEMYASVGKDIACGNQETSGVDESDGGKKLLMDPIDESELSEVREHIQLSQSNSEERMEEERVMEDLREFKMYRPNGNVDNDSSDDSEDDAGDSDISGDDDSDYRISDSESTESGTENENELDVNQNKDIEGGAENKNTNGVDDDIPIQSTRKNSSVRSRGRTDARVLAPCPFPPEPQNRSRKRKRHSEITRELEQTQSEEIRNMIQFLRTRTSLHSASAFTPGNLHDAEGSDSFQNFQFLRKSCSYAGLHNSVKTWGAGLQKTVTEDPYKLVYDHFSQFLCSNLGEQLKKEFFFWGSKLGQDQELGSPNRHSCWQPTFMEFAKRHPNWKYYTEQDLQNSISGAGTSCLLDLQKMNKNLSDVMKRGQKWRDDIDEAASRKLLFMKKFRTLESNIEMKDKRLDEFCHWGKKALRTLFSAPYFKFSNLDYTNLVRSDTYLENVYGEALLSEGKQKWTNKDRGALKRIIQDVCLDQEYAALTRKYNYFIARITYERTSRLQQDEDNCKSNQNKFQNRENKGSDELGRGMGSWVDNFRVNMKKRTQKCEYSETTIRRNYKVTAENEGRKFSVKYTVKAIELQKWFHQQEMALRKRTYEELMGEERIISKIDWHSVAGRLSAETGKDRSPTDCRLVWLHDANPKVSNKRWLNNDIKKLMEFGRNTRLNWNEIAVRMGEGRTAYQCFFKYRNQEVLTQVMKWDANKDNLTQEVLMNEGPKWEKAVQATLDPRATKHQVQERWKRTSNPMLRNGAFTRVEDALLLLSLEKLKGFIRAEGHCGILLAYLPWRFESAWRDRAGNLFSSWIVPWTIAEDMKLLGLVQSQGSGRKNWQKIADEFTSFKNRKGCLTRFKILNSKIGTGPKKFKSIEEYHEAYSMTRYNVFQYSHLRDVVELLERILTTKSLCSPFPGLCRTKPPSELELRWMLLDFDKDIVKQTIQTLGRYIESRDKYWKNWMTENGQIIKTFDRRTFHREDPKSVASAIHIRGIELVPQDQIQGHVITSFQSDVYFHYARFCRTKSIKIYKDDGRKVERRYIPSAKLLSRMPEICHILKLPLISNEDTESDIEWKDETSIAPRKRGRPRKSVLPTSLDNNNVSQPSGKRRGRPPKSVSTSKETSSLTEAINVATADGAVHTNGIEPPAKKKKVTLSVSDTSCTDSVAPDSQRSLLPISSDPGRRRGRTRISKIMKISSQTAPIDVYSTEDSGTTEDERYPAKQKRDVLVASGTTNSEKVAPVALGILPAISAGTGRRRGRPRKSGSTTTSSQAEAIDVCSLAKNKSKVVKGTAFSEGVVSVTVGSVTAKNSAPEKRRGRPRKLVPEARGDLVLNDSSSKKEMASTSSNIVESGNKHCKSDVLRRKSTRQIPKASYEEFDYLGDSE